MSVPNLPAVRGYVLYWNPATMLWQAAEQAAGGGGVAWGAITGTLLDQTDLQTELDAKEDEANKGVAGGYAGLDGSSKVAIANLPTGATSSTVCIGDDSRLSDARTPTAHASSHQSGGSDEVATATAGANAIPKAGAGGTLAIGWIPTGATSSTVCIGNDARLSDARTPLTHATSHKSGGSDAIKLDELAAPTDITTLNASASAHGLLPKLSNVSTEFLNGTGAFSTPAGGGGGGISLGLAIAVSRVGTLR